MTPVGATAVSREKYKEPENPVPGCGILVVNKLVT